MRKLFLLSFLIASFAIADKTTFTTKSYDGPHATGLKRTADSLSFIQSSAQKRFELDPTAESDIEIPDMVDLSPLVSPPENQGGCGSCWDFSLVKALRSALMLAGKDPGVLSFNYLLNNCGPGPSMWGCNGGDFDAGKSFLNGAGPWLESQDPYTQREGRCKTGLNVAGTALEMVFLGSGNRPATFQEIAAAHADNRMLAIDVAVAGSWGSYSGGIYNGNGSGINHMINGVGHNCETSVKVGSDGKKKCVFNAQGQPINGDGYLIVMNNWGTSWGERGYMRTRWGRNQIATTAAYFQVKKEPPPPIPPVPPVPVPGPSNMPVWVWILLGAVGSALVIGVVTWIVNKVKSLAK